MRTPNIEPSEFQKELISIANENNKAGFKLHTLADIGRLASQKTGHKPVTPAYVQQSLRRWNGVRLTPKSKARFEYNPHLPTPRTMERVADYLAGESTSEHTPPYKTLKSMGFELRGFGARNAALAEKSHVAAEALSKLWKQDLPAPEIAARLGITTPSLYVKVTLARKKFPKLFPYRRK